MRATAARRWSNRGALAALAVLCVMTPLFSASVATARTALAPPPDATTDAKPPLRGLVERWTVPSPDVTEWFGGFAFQVTWSQLEPKKGAYNFSLIDAALGNGAAFGLRARLRVKGGTGAPAWLYAAAGKVFINDPGAPPQGIKGSVPRWWTPAYTNAYAALQSALAARYDNDDRLAEVTFGLGSVFSASETMLNRAGNRATLTKAGYTVAKDIVAQEAALDVHARVWSRTRTYLALSPFWRMDMGKADLATTYRLADHARSVLGSRLTLANQSLVVAADGTPLVDARKLDIYRYLTTRADAGDAVSIQVELQVTLDAKRGDRAASLVYAAQVIHATDVEPTYVASDPLSDWASYWS